MFDIKEICDRAHVSRQTVYRLIRENEDFRKLTEQNREKRGNGFIYGSAVLDWLISYYSKGSTPDGVEAAAVVPEGAENVEIPEDILLQMEELQALRDENNALRTQVEELRKALEDKESERKQLFDNVQHLLLLLSQEKAEKQQLLPAPKQSLFQRVFGRKKT